MNATNDAYDVRVFTVCGKDHDQQNISKMIMWYCNIYSPSQNINRFRCLKIPIILFTSSQRTMCNRCHCRVRWKSVNIILPKLWARVSWFFINFISTLFSPVWQPAREQTALQPSETLLQSIGLMHNIKKKNNKENDASVTSLLQLQVRHQTTKPTRGALWRTLLYLANIASSSHLPFSCK